MAEGFCFTCNHSSIGYCSFHDKSVGALDGCSDNDDSKFVGALRRTNNTSPSVTRIHTDCSQLVPAKSDCCDQEYTDISEENATAGQELKNCTPQDYYRSKL